MLDVGHGDIEHCVNHERSGQTADLDANVEMPSDWRCVSLPPIRTERSTPLARVRHELRTKRYFVIINFTKRREVRCVWKGCT